MPARPPHPGARRGRPRRRPRAPSRAPPDERSSGSKTLGYLFPRIPPANASFIRSHTHRSKPTIHRPSHTPTSLPGRVDLPGLPFETVTPQTLPVYPPSFCPLEVPRNWLSGRALGYTSFLNPLPGPRADEKWLSLGAERSQVRLLHFAPFVSFRFIPQQGSPHGGPYGGVSLTARAFQPVFHSFARPRADREMVIDYQSKGAGSNPVRHPAPSLRSPFASPRPRAASPFPSTALAAPLSFFGSLGRPLQFW